MTANPKIDVLLPAYNAAETMEDTLESIAQQSFTDFRVISVDDGSSDATKDILTQWAARDSRFTFVSLENGGIVKALNTALSMATAPYVARIDADDICDVHRFKKQYQYLEAHPQAVAVGGIVEHIDETGAILEGFYQPGDPNEADPNRIPAREPYIIHPFLMARTASLNKIGGYRHVPHSEDSDLFWRLRDLGKLYNPPDIVGQYRMHTNSISGGSVLNGRIMAVGSQLGAWAARQRIAGKKDPELNSDIIHRLRDAKTLDLMCKSLSPLIDAADMQHFRLAVGIKLLELSAYRPYEIEDSDISFISAAVESGKSLVLPEGNWGHINWHLSTTGARLLQLSRPRDAFRLTPILSWPKMLAKSVLKKPFEHK